MNNISAVISDMSSPFIPLCSKGNSFLLYLYGILTNRTWHFVKEQFVTIVYFVIANIILHSHSKILFHAGNTFLFDSKERSGYFEAGSNESHFARFFILGSFKNKQLRAQYTLPKINDEINNYFHRDGTQLEWRSIIRAYYKHVK